MRGRANYWRRIRRLGGVPGEVKPPVRKPAATSPAVPNPAGAGIIWMDPDEPPHRAKLLVRTSDAATARPSPSSSSRAEPVVAPPTLVVNRSGAAPAEQPITDEEFEGWVEDALDRVPEQFLGAVENVAFIVEHDPPGGGRNLLGLYHGVPLPGRGHYSGAMPDTITIYQNPLVRVFRTRERVKEEVYRTVVHEIGHYFGMDDDELHGLGW